MPFRKLFAYSGGQKNLLPCLMELLPEHTTYVEVFFGGGCYSHDTEVLTENGWKHFNEVHYDDYICTRDKDGNIEYQKPSKIIWQIYRGKMYYLRSSKHLDLLVTLRHDLYVSFPRGRHKKFGSFERVEAKDVFGRDHRHTCTAKWCGTYKSIIEIPSVTIKKYVNSGIMLLPADEFMEFIGWYLAEGFVSIYKKSYRIWICQKSDVNKQEIAAIIRLMGFHPKIYGKGVSFFSKQLVEYLRPLGKSYEKYVPEEIKCLSSQLLERLVATYLKGDGSGGSNAWTAWTSSTRLRDDMQELALKLGWRLSYSLQGKAGQVKKFRNETRIYRHDSWQLNIARKSTSPWVTNKMRKTRGFKEDIIQYDGIVGCVEVPNHVIFVRRNGKPIWCGNSVFFNKDPSEVEIINDIDKRLVNLLKVVKDRPEEFERELRFLPNSRDLFKEYKKNVLHETDDVKRAVMFYYILHNTWSGSSKIGQWVMKTRNTSKIDELSWFADRLRHVNIENLDCVDLIEKYDKPDTFFFLDPPYADIFGLYEHSFEDDDHIRLARVLKSIDGMFLLTYNSHPLIEMLYKGYPQFIYETKVTMSPIGKGEIRRMEAHLIVANYDIINHNFKRWRAGYFQL